MAYLFILQRQRVHRVFRDRQNPLDYMGDEELMNKYRLPREKIFDLCDLLQEDLERPTNRSHALPVSLQILIALRYFGTGTFQKVIADAHGV